MKGWTTCCLALTTILLAGNGCVGTKAFTTAARAGDTVSLGVGWNKNITRQNITVTVKDFTGATVATYAPNDSRVRAIVNLYPDPVSRLVVGTETAQSLTFHANDHGTDLLNNVTGQDKDWMETTIFLDLPATVPVGSATIEITGPTGAVTPSPIGVEILPGAGSANIFAGASGNLAVERLATLERTNAYVVTFTGSTVPHAIHLELNHTFGVGTTWVVNPRGDLKNVAWTDTGSTLRIVVTPANGQTLQQMAHFKFYVAGGIAGLTVSSGSPKAYDINGNLISGVSAVIQ